MASTSLHTDHLSSAMLHPVNHRTSAGEVLQGVLSRVVGRLPAVLEGLWGLSQIEKAGENWGKLLERCAARHPEQTAVKSHEGNLSYAELNARANQVAHWLLQQGVGRGDVVNLLCEARPELHIVYSGAAKIGAINAMINTRLTGDALRYQLELHPARVNVVGAECWEAFRQAAPRSAQSACAWVREALAPEAVVPTGVTDLVAACAALPGDNPRETQAVEPSDTLAYVFTSGTTGGKPKAARVTHRRVASSTFFNGRVVLGLAASDTLYVPLPFFHTNALALSWPACLARGAAVAVRRRFSVSSFLDDVRAFDASAFCYIGELCRYLLASPARPDDAQTPLVQMIGNGLRPELWDEFRTRFGIRRVFEIYGGAESNLYFVNLLNVQRTVGMSISPYALVEANLEDGTPVRDERGRVVRVPPGKPGLLLGKVARLTPFAGYSNEQESSKKVVESAFEPGDRWFNSGDLLRDRGFGHLEFVDRLGDTFRWKGENVAAAELEDVANRRPEIAMSAAYGVVLPQADGRIGMIAVRLNGGQFPARELARDYERALPSYARPVFARVVEQIEETATHKLMKFSLRSQGFDPHTIADPLYVWLPGKHQYEPLTPEIASGILRSDFKF